MLYADDTMRLLSESLQEAVPVIFTFGTFSELVINWTKSSIMLIDDSPNCQDSMILNIPISPSFKYLGIYVTTKPLNYIFLHLSPFLGRI